MLPGLTKWPQKLSWDDPAWIADTGQAQISSVNARLDHHRWPVTVQLARLHKCIWQATMRDWTSADDKRRREIGQVPSDQWRLETITVHILPNRPIAVSLRPVLSFMVLISRISTRSTAARSIFTAGRTSNNRITTNYPNFPAPCRNFHSSETVRFTMKKKKH